MSMTCWRAVGKLGVEDESGGFSQSRNRVRGEVERKEQLIAAQLSTVTVQCSTATVKYGYSEVQVQ